MKREGQADGYASFILRSLSTKWLTSPGIPILKQEVILPNRKKYKQEGLTQHFTRNRVERNDIYVNDKSVVSVHFQNIRRISRLF
jgi:hypothetical protein